jgi:hypothetical protein
MIKIYSMHKLLSYVNSLIVALLFTVVLLAGCKKNELPPEEIFVRAIPLDGSIIYPTTQLDSISLINKSTSWFNTNKAFDELFDVKKSLFSGFELGLDNKFYPFNYTNENLWNASKNYYWFNFGSYIYTDLTGDEKKDLWAYYLKNPWPTNSKGLHLFTEYQNDSTRYDLQFGLTEVRKCVVADLDNDKKKEIVLFSTGYDALPFPGDSIGIFYPSTKKYKYLSADRGYFQGGATGDINGDGLQDIIAYSGGSKTVPIHPTAYINKGNNNFQLSNNIFRGFTETRDDNFYTVELFDVNGDGFLDMILGARDRLRVVIYKAGLFNKANAISLPILPGLEVMDVAFLDFDGDGSLDILTMNNMSAYQGYALRLYLNRGTKFIDVTKEYFDVFEEGGKNTWIKWIHLFDYDKDGDLDVVADGLYGELYDNRSKIFWQNNTGFFKYRKD